MRISDWSSDVCSSDLSGQARIEAWLPGRNRHEPEAARSSSSSPSNILSESRAMLDRNGNAFIKEHYEGPDPSHFGKVPIVHGIADSDKPADEKNFSASARPSSPFRRRCRYASLAWRTSSRSEERRVGTESVITGRS